MTDKTTSMWQTVPLAQLGIRRKARWPVVVGIISMAYGSLVVMGNLFQALFLGAAGALIVLVPLLIGMVLNLLCPLGGYLLIKRKSSGRKALVAWSLMTIVLCFLSFILILIGIATMSIEDSGKANLKDVWVLALMPFLMAIYPVFLLIWLSRRFVRRDLKEW